uniref:Uncharacterized protein n=1 Tax=Arundo donax TaxID=35708 RepID=A0A0A9BS15_ARUDO
MDLLEREAIRRPRRRCKRSFTRHGPGASPRRLDQRRPDEGAQARIATGNGGQR